MPGSSPGMTIARGVLKRHCAIGKTPLLTARLCNRPWGCQSAAPPEYRLARPRPSFALCARSGMAKVSTAAERIVALIFPVATLVVVGDFHRDHVFRILETEFGGHPDLHRIAVGPGQDFVGEFERHLGLRMQRRRHVERAVVAIGIRALEPAIFRAGIGTDYFKKIA